MPRVINRTSSGGTNALLGGIGQGLTNFAGSYMGRQQLDQQKAQQAQQNAMMEKIFGNMGQNPMGMGAASPQTTVSPPAIQSPMVQPPTMTAQAPGDLTAPEYDLNTLMAMIRGGR